MTEIPKLFDAYQRQARVYPALLSLLPVIAALLAWFPALLGKSIGGALVSVAAACGALFWLADVARTRGKAIEPKLLAAWGGWPTVLWLRHSDQHLPPDTKSRYHARLSQGAGLTLPSPTEERLDPAAADAKYASATGWLLEVVRQGKYPLVPIENAAYGFRRNMLGLKPIGVAICIATLATSAGVAYARYNLQRNIEFLANVTARVPAPILGALLVSAVALVLWVATVNRPWVRAAGDQYARALLACCESVPALSSRSKPKPKK